MGCGAAGFGLGFIPGVVLVRYWFKFYEFSAQAETPRKTFGQTFGFNLPSKHGRLGGGYGSFATAHRPEIKKKEEGDEGEDCGKGDGENANVTIRVHL